MQWISWIADVFGIVGAIFALMAWLESRRIRANLRQEQERQNRKVTVVLQHGANKLELPVELRRAELTRAEVLGRLGMLPMKNKGVRFALGYVNTPEFFRSVGQVAASSGDAILTIPCSADEFAQFDLDKA